VFQHLVDGFDIDEFDAFDQVLINLFNILLVALGENDGFDSSPDGTEFFPLIRQSAVPAR